nr:hypothetical protein [Angustibacter aerolatus]
MGAAGRAAAVRRAAGDGARRAAARRGPRPRPGRRGPHPVAAARAGRGRSGPSPPTCC